MIPKYTIEYSAVLKRHTPISHFSTDDPVACEGFVQELLEGGYKIRGIKHEGVDLSRTEFDRMIKTAAGALAASRICFSLGIRPEEEHHRFGFAA